jgi:type IV pilus assembly protein PilX
MHHRRQQSGTALVISMVLLMVLTVLAISGMSTASTEMIMAGNEQLRNDAFNAAEAGIARTTRLSTFNPDPLIGIENFNGNVPGTPDTFASTVNPRGQSQGFYFFSNDDFTTYYFDVRSTGSSARGATATNMQGVALPRQSDNTVGCLNGTPPPCLLN